MALSLVVGTNTYLTLADAEAYMLRRYDPSGLWATATDAVKNTLLAQATLDIDRQVWSGYKSSPDQALEFPRNGYTITDPTYDKVEQATVEQALWLLVARPETRQNLQSQGVASISLGDVSETYRAGGAADLAPRARSLLAAWVIGSAALV